MKKLQNKTFLLLVSILTLFLMSMLIIFNVSIYHNENKKIHEKMIRAANAHEKFNPNKNDFRNPMFMDTEVYVVSFDRNGSIRNIYSYTEDGLTEQEIIKLANENIGKASRRNIGNLYWNKYVFSFNPNGDFMIVNNSSTRDYLVSNLFKSFIIFVILELIILYISNLLTKWLVKPVEESFNRQKQFISDASHELKTPISVIMASVETYMDNPKEQKWLDNIKSETERMNQLVINLLELSKSEDAIQKEIYTEVNLSKIIEKKALSFESLMFESDVTLKLNISNDIHYHCNQEKIKELLSILIDNAIKHSYKKSQIEVSLEKHKDTITLSVTNRGDAIPKEEQDKIFDRFYRVDKSRNRDSNRYGLGLAIAKNIAQNHGGIITVNCVNGYTTFRVELKQN